jgi:hypothetical protein
MIIDDSAGALVADSGFGFATRLLEQLRGFFVGLLYPPYETVRGSGRWKPLRPRCCAPAQGKGVIGNISDRQGPIARRGEQFRNAPLDLSRSLAHW